MKEKRIVIDAKDTRQAGRGVYVEPLRTWGEASAILQTLASEGFDSFKIEVR